MERREGKGSLREVEREGVKRRKGKQSQTGTKRRKWKLTGAKGRSKEEEQNWQGREKKNTRLRSMEISEST